MFAKSRSLKKRKTGEGLEDVYVSKWVHYKHLEFLDTYITPKNTRSNLQVNIMYNCEESKYSVHAVKSCSLAMAQPPYQN